LLPVFWANPLESARFSLRLTVYCVLSAVFQALPAVPEAENIESPNVMSKNKEKRKVFNAN
jgi:hypothetical protein